MPSAVPELSMSLQLRPNPRRTAVSTSDSDPQKLSELLVLIRFVLDRARRVEQLAQPRFIPLPRLAAGSQQQQAGPDAS
jgi:hypothetical protein